MRLKVNMTRKKIKESESGNYTQDSRQVTGDRSGVGVGVGAGVGSGVG